MFTCAISVMSSSRCCSKYDFGASPVCVPFAVEARTFVAIVVGAVMLMCDW